MALCSNEEAVAAIRAMIDADALRSVQAIAERLNLTELAVRLGIPRRSLRRIFNTVEEAAIAVRLAMLDDVGAELDAVSEKGDCSEIMLRDVCACLVKPEHVTFFLDHGDVLTAFERRALSSIDAAVFRGGFDEGLYWAEGGANGAAEFVLDLMRGLVMATDGSKRPPKPWVDERTIDRFESHMRLIMRALDQDARHVIFTEMTDLDRIEGGMRIERNAAAESNGIAAEKLR